MMPRLQIRTLGPFEVQLDTKAISWFPTDRERALLLILALAPDLTQQRGAIASLIWSDLDDAAARRNLRVSLVRLKKVLGEDVDTLLAVSRQEIGLISAESDHNQFQTLIKSDSPSDWQMAVDLIGGELAEGFALKNSALFEEWLTRQRQALHKQHVALLQKLLGTASIPSEASLHYAQQLTELEPYDDAVQRQIMAAYVDMGNLPAAIGHYDQYAELLRQTIGADPEAATVALRNKLFTVHASGPATLYNIPFQVTEFIGRDGERAAVVDLLRQPSCRMVTLLGAGGLGKTRLSVEVAQQLTTELFADGVYFAPLVTANNDFDALAILHRVLALKTQGDDLEAQLFAHLRDKQLLLILDNVEQLTGKLRFLPKLLQSAAGVKLLVTSRDVVGISAENRFPLSGISDLHDASSLLWSAIQRISPDFELNATNMAIGAKICEQLHGVPLALQLAATWISTLDLESIRAEIEHAYAFLESPLHDTPDRHRSLGAIFDHSWDLLTPKRQMILAKASVFRGGLNMKAARALLGAGINDLRRLVEQSLLVRGENKRYSLHELVREFATDKLTAAEQAEVEQAHAAYYLKLVAALEKQLVSEQSRAASSLVSADLANVVRAWQWAVTNNDQTQLTATVTAMTNYYRLTGRFSQGNRLFVETIAQLGGAVDKGLLARLHIGCSTVRMWQSRHQASVNSAENALAAAQAADDKVLIAESLLCHGRALRALGNWMLAVPLFQQGLITAQAALSEASPADRIDDIRGEILTHMALISLMGGSYTVGHQVAEMALAAVQPSGNKLIESFTLSIYSYANMQIGSYSKAFELAESALLLSQTLGTPLYEALALSMRGRAYRSIGEMTAALAETQKSLELYEDIGDELGQIISLMQVVQTRYEKQDFALAVEIADETIKRAAASNLSFYQAYTIYLSGLALCSLNRLDEAEASFEEVAALAVANRFPDQYKRLVGFGLGGVAFCRGSAENALNHIDALIDEVLGLKLSEQNNETLRFITGYHILDANNDSRALPFLKMLHSHLMMRADKLEDLSQRQVFLENIPRHRDIVTAYQNRIAPQA